MDRKTLDDRIYRDLKVVQKSILDVLEKPETNWVIYQPHYIGPTITTQPRPLEDPNGKLMYFMRIQETLRQAILHGEIPKDRIPHKAPPYLKELAK
ncbi:hypothetical protein GOV05_04080 [Candidatus Woesearchaeota archaeon]|nr:hypothetical protein [Candidatus Woesearchaeota archaeon]